jgi:hypothetical protein
MDNLTSMGLSETDAEYYTSEYNNGNPILIVRAAERGTEALNVLRQYGAYTAQTGSAYAREATGDMQQPAAYTQEDNPTADMQPSGDYAQESSYGAPGQHDNVQDLETETHTQAGEEHPYAGTQPENATPEYDLSDQDTQIITPRNDRHAQDMDARAQDMEANTYTSASTYDTGNQASWTETATREQESETPASPLSSGTPQQYGEHQDVGTGETAAETDTDEQNVQSTPSRYATAPGYWQASVPAPETTTSDGAAQTGTDTTTPEQDYGSQAAQASAPDMTGYDSQPDQVMQSTPATANQPTDMQPEQASAATPEQTDELQQLQAQLQTLQQQLQEAKARLAAAKEQENQLKTAREREQQLQSARQQLQDIQAELQATLAEHQEVQSRIAQYQ